MVTGTVASMAYMLLGLHEHPWPYPVCRLSDSFAGRPHKDAFGRDCRCACASVANLPQCDHDTATTRLQDKGKIMIHWYHLIASAYVLIIVLHFCIILEFSIPFQVQCTWQIAKIHGLDWERGRKQHLLDLVLLLEFLVLLLEHLCLRQGQKGWCSHGCECHQLV